MIQIRLTFKIDPRFFFKKTDPGFDFKIDLRFKKKNRNRDLDLKIFPERSVIDFCFATGFLF